MERKAKQKIVKIRILQLPVGSFLLILDVKGRVAGKKICETFWITWISA